MLAHVQVTEETGKIRIVTHVADGVIDGRRFNIGVSPAVIEFRLQDPDQTVTIEWGELTKALVEATMGDDEGWTPLERTDEAFDRLTRERRTPDEGEEIWANNLYVVNVRRKEGVTHLSFHRRDRAPIRDWRHVQRIKNEVCGPEFEGVELYPAEARLVDTSNQYHCWVLSDGQGSPVRIPLGFEDRMVLTPEELDNEYPSAVQRPFQEHT